MSLTRRTVMVTVTKAESIGCVDYGNNNFFEIMVDHDGTVGFMSHDDCDCSQNPDGTFSGEVDSVDKFLTDISDRHDYQDIVTQLISELAVKVNKFSSNIA
jgi:hypothetical protein